VDETNRKRQVDQLLDLRAFGPDSAFPRLDFFSVQKWLLAESAI